MNAPMHDRAARIESFYEAIVRADRRTLPGAAMPPEFATTEADDSGWVRWTPIRQTTDPAEVEKVYSRIPGRMPKLFEDCLMSFGWLTVELGGIDLFPHHPQSGLKVFVENVLRDEALFPALFRHRYVPLGRAAGGSYDPICFDLKRSRKRDCPLVRIDHESVLIHENPVVIAELAPSFDAWLGALRT